MNKACFIMPGLKEIRVLDIEDRDREIFVSRSPSATVCDCYFICFSSQYTGIETFLLSPKSSLYPIPLR